MRTKRDHGATFRFRVNQLNRVVWVNGNYALNARPACWESGFSLSLRNRRAPIDAEHRFTVRGRSGVNHMFVIRGTMLSETRAKGCAGDFRFVWRAHRL